MTAQDMSVRAPSPRVLGTGLASAASASSPTRSSALIPSKSSGTSSTGFSSPFPGELQLEQQWAWLNLSPMQGGDSAGAVVCPGQLFLCLEEDSEDTG